MHISIIQEQLLGMSIDNKYAGSETVIQIIRHRAKYPGYIYKYNKLIFLLKYHVLHIDIENLFVSLKFEQQERICICWGTNLDN